MVTKNRDVINLSESVEISGTRLNECVVMLPRNVAVNG